MSIYTIYLATNKINQKSYVGFTANWPGRLNEHIRSSFNKNAADYNTYFHNAIRKYGPDAFEWNVVFQAQGDLETGKWLNLEIEPLFIQEIKTHAFSKDHLGYNMTLGGEGALGAEKSVKTRRLLSIANSGNKNHMYGKHHSPEGKEKRSIANSKLWLVTFPDKHSEKITNLYQFAKENDLDTGALSAVAKGIRKHHKGFRIEGPITSS